MPTEKERLDVMKSMAYDIIDIIESNPEKENYTPEEIKTLIKAYLTGEKG